jgi:hypothetical protein
MGGDAESKNIAQALKHEKKYRATSAGNIVQGK